MPPSVGRREQSWGRTRVRGGQDMEVALSVTLIFSESRRVVGAPVLKEMLEVRAVL